MGGPERHIMVTCELGFILGLVKAVRQYGHVLECSRTDRNQLVVSKGVIFEQNLNFSPQLRIESLPSRMCQAFQ